MNKNFWLEKWEQKQIAFHQSKANSLLINNIDKLNLKDESRIFIPLCGKTLDIAYLLSKGYKVAGAELSEIAINELFEELEIVPQIADLGTIKHYSANNIDIFVGDIFDLNKDILNSIDAIYDRAALVALPLEMRKRYSQHLINITENAPQLLIAYEYDQTKVDGPPFSIIDKEIYDHYKQSYKLTCIEKLEVKGGLKGQYHATENVWLLTDK